MEILTWVVIGIVGLIAVAAIVTYAIKFFKLDPDQRTELLVQFLMGLVAFAEDKWINNPGSGKEKFAWVEQQFNKTAPWFLKIVLALTKTANLKDLIELALKKIKESFGE